MKLVELVLVMAIPAVASVACATTTRAGHPAPEAGQHAARPGMMAEMCPMQIAGATVTFQQREDGAALIFTTKTGDIAELRRRVQHMAERMDGAKCPMMGMP